MRFEVSLHRHGDHPVWHNGIDFKQYRRFWKLIPVDGGTHTKAEFELTVEVDTIVPDWMVAVAMKRDLESHFRIMREKALAQQARE